jgi:hypothetical protein
MSDVVRVLRGVTHMYTGMCIHSNSPFLVRIRIHIRDKNSTGETTGTGPVAGVPGPVIVGPHKNPCPGWSHNCPAPKAPVRGGLTIACSEKPLSGVVSQLQNRRPGPGTGTGR